MDYFLYFKKIPLSPPFIPFVWSSDMLERKEKNRKKGKRPLVHVCTGMLLKRRKHPLGRKKTSKQTQTNKQTTTKKQNRGLSLESEGRAEWCIAADWRYAGQLQKAWRLAFGFARRTREELLACTWGKTCHPFQKISSCWNTCILRGTVSTDRRKSL